MLLTGTAYVRCTACTSLHLGTGSEVWLTYLRTMDTGLSGAMGSKRSRNRCQHGLRSTVASIATLSIRCNRLLHGVHMSVHTGTRYTQASTEKEGCISSTCRYQSYSQVGLSSLAQRVVINRELPIFTQIWNVGARHLSRSIT